MNSLEDISTVFNILHDAGIASWSSKGELLILTVDCIYLAERIDKNFDKFFVELGGIEKLALEPWTIPVGSPSIKKITPQEIFAGQLEILSADIKENYVLVTCHQHDTDLNYVGGNLIIACNSIKVYDQEMKSISISEFNNLAKQYWIDFRNK